MKFSKMIAGDATMSRLPDLANICVYYLGIMLMGCEASENFKWSY